MPYVKQEERMSPILSSPGKLNYILTTTIIEYVATHGESYTVYNEVLGVLTAIQHELYRRRIAPYEDKKIEENGDVY